MWISASGACAIARVLGVLALYAVTATAFAVPDGWGVRIDHGEEIFSPTRLAPGEIYHLHVSTAQALEGAPLRDWFASTVDQDVSALGKVWQRLPIEASGEDTVSRTVLVDVGEGELRRVHYLGFQGRGLALRVRIVTNGGNDLLERHAAGMQAVLKAIFPLRLKGIARASDDDPVDAEAADRRRDLLKANATRPAYVLPAPYEALLCDSRTRYEADGNMRIDYTIHLLLDDGTVYSGLEVPPEDFDPARMRRKHPERWGTWRRDGDLYQLTQAGDTGEPTTLGEASRLAPARIDERLDRRIYHSVASGSVLIGGASVSTRRWRFDAFGRFGRGRHFLGGSGMLQDMASGTSSYVASTRDEQGERSTSGASGPNFAAGSSREGGDGADSRGEYHLSGHTLALHYDDGTAETKLFGFCYGKRDNPFVDGRVHWMSESAAEEALPSDWEQRVSDSEQMYYVPPGLREREVLQVWVAPPRSVASTGFDAWFQRMAEADIVLVGEPAEGGRLERGDPLSTYTGHVRDGAGRALVVMYYGAAIDDSGRAVRIVTSGTDVLKRHMAALKPMLAKAFR